MTGTTLLIIALVLVFGVIAIGFVLGMMDIHIPGVTDKDKDKR